MKLKRYFFKIASLMTFLAIGIGIGWYINNWQMEEDVSKPSFLRENNSDYSFINPLLLVGGLRENPEYSALKKSVASYISNTIKNRSATSISIYFQDMNNANWTGVNETELYDPSSMMKVAMMVGYLKKAVNDPKILTKQLQYIPTNNHGQHYPPEHVPERGYYPTRELIEYMIVDSDNDALKSLYDKDRDAFVSVFKELNMPPPADINTLDFMSPKIYSRIFRTLYSSTFLPRQVSEQALQLLSYTKFNNGLVASIPSNLIVSHKFGEHTTLDLKGNIVEVQLHDCGIIYFPGKPYFLCVMTKGNDFDKLESVISQISKITYDYWNERK